MSSPRNARNAGHDPLYHHRQCEAKRAYETKREAKEVARIGTSKYGYPLREYECPLCGLWHVTKLSKVAQHVARQAALRERSRGNGEQLK